MIHRIRVFILDHRVKKKSGEHRYADNGSYLCTHSAKIENATGRKCKPS